VLYNHRGWLPADLAQQHCLASQGWRLGARLAPGIGAHAAAPYHAPGDEIEDDDGFAAVLQLLDAADAQA
jgi:hypothetical protein